MGYYAYQDHVLYAQEPLPYQKLDSLPASGEILYMFRRPPLTGRETFAVTDPGLLTAAEGVETLCGGDGAAELPAELLAAVQNQRVRAVNAAHPRWAELLDMKKAPARRRVHLLALGDVGSTLAIGLRLLGGEEISTIGVCDMRPNVAERWVFELNQIDTPCGDRDFPAVEKVEPENLFDCDVFLFCASRFVPDTAVKSGDVRMAQYELNRELAVSYARRAREAGFGGLFCVVSDPVDPLCRAVLLESNKNEAGELDYRGLFPHQVRGFGLGVMNARARYYAQREPRFAAFLEDGRAFGPHGEGLVVANSISHYDDAVSRELTDRTKHANLEMRQLGFKPYVAPALSSGALSLLLCLGGQWHCSSVFLDGVFMGVRNREAINGPEVERLPLPEALRERLGETMEQLREIPV